MKTQAIILAAGKGTRMKSLDQNKCLSLVGGKPMITYPLAALKKMGIEKPIVVVGFAQESIRAVLGDSVTYAEQTEMTGTATALRAGMTQVDPETDQVIVLYGDHSTFYNKEVLENLLKTHEENHADMTLITVMMSNPTGYGRIMRSESGDLLEIVEEKNATDEQRKIREINSGNGVYSTQFLKKALPLIEKNDISQEFYLTDLLKIGVDNHFKICALVSENEALSLGVNTPEQLAQANEYAATHQE